jgi:hypothetical protein
MWRGEIEKEDEKWENSLGMVNFENYEETVFLEFEEGEVPVANIVFERVIRSRNNFLTAP